MRSVWIAGASGLVGSSIVTEAAERAEFHRVTALVRRRMQRVPDHVDQYVADFARLDTVPCDGVTDVFCALGTTIKKAGSQAAFRQVDIDIPLALARASRRCGVSCFALVSSVGASSASSNFYLQTKGELEDELRKVGFERLLIFRPSILLGERAESRPGERVGAAAGSLIAPLLIGGLRRYRPVRAATVARAMVNAVLASAAGTHVFEYPDIMALASL